MPVYSDIITIGEWTNVPPPFAAPLQDPSVGPPTPGVPARGLWVDNTWEENHAADDYRVPYNTYGTGPVFSYGGLGEMGGNRDMLRYYWGKLSYNIPSNLTDAYEQDAVFDGSIHFDITYQRAPVVLSEPDYDDPTGIEFYNGPYHGQFAIFAYNPTIDSYYSLTTFDPSFNPTLVVGEGSRKTPRTLEFRENYENGNVRFSPGQGAYFAMLGYDIYIEIGLSTASSAHKWTTMWTTSFNPSEQVWSVSYKTKNSGWKVGSI